MPFLHTGSVLFNGFESGQVHIFIAMLIILGIAILEFNSRKNEWNKCKNYFVGTHNVEKVGTRLHSKMIAHHVYNPSPHMHTDIH